MNSEPEQLHRNQWSRLAAWVTATLILPSAGWACPLCDSGTGQQVREGIFGDDFWTTLLAIIAPFPVLILILVTMHFGLPRFGKRQVASHPTSTQENSSV